MSEYLAKMKKQGFEELVMIQDANVGLKAVIAIHNTGRGPALGGTRMWTYPSEDAAVDDVMHLARCMSYKSAAAELPLGGGKGVIIGDPHTDKSKALFHAYARHLKRMGGRFITAADMGIHEGDLDCMREACDHILGGSVIGSPSPFTAFGVWQGIKACAKEVYGSEKLAGKTVAVQGVGSVGEALCRHLHEDGARLIVTDIDQEPLEMAKKEFQAEVVDPDDIYGQDCDIFAPCGTGGVVNQDTIDQFKCKIIAGGANNVVKEKQYEHELKKRGILLAPDYIINAGGIIFVEMKRQGISDHEQIKKVVARIKNRLEEVLHRAREQDLLPREMADIFAEERLQK
ncbi:MAG: Glu/Leu/Phe/Val dehydrogenase dimerization domain-containing protein [Bacillota bacterium]